MGIPYSYMKSDYRKPRPKIASPTYIPITQPTLIYQCKPPADTSYDNSLTREYLIHRTPSPQHLQKNTSRVPSPNVSY